MWTLNIGRKILKEITQECYKLYWTSPKSNSLKNSSCTATYDPLWKPFKLDEPDMWDTAREVRTNSWAMYSGGPLDMDDQRLDNRLEPIYSSLMPIQYVAWKTCRKWRMTEIGGKKESGKSVIAAEHDDDSFKTCFIYIYMCDLNVL